MELPVSKPDPNFTELHWDTFFSLLDAVVSSIIFEGPTSSFDKGQVLSISEESFQAAYEHMRNRLKHPLISESFRNYLAARPLADPKFKSVVKGSIAKLPESSRKQLSTVLTFLVSVL
jgi:hypothetical protein